MEVEYQLTEADMVALTMYRLRQAPGRRNPLLLRGIPSMNEAQLKAGSDAEK